MPSPNGYGSPDEHRPDAHGPPATGTCDAYDVHGHSQLADTRTGCGIAMDGSGPQDVDVDKILGALDLRSTFMVGSIPKHMTADSLSVSTTPAHPIPH